MKEIVRVHRWKFKLGKKYVWKYEVTKTFDRREKLVKTHEFGNFENKNHANIPISKSWYKNKKFSKFFKNAKKTEEGAL